MAGLTVNPDTDPQAFSAIYEGLTIAQLAKMFNVSQDVVAQATAKVKPVRRQGRGYIYSVAEIGPHICRPTTEPEQLAEYIKTLHPNQLPMMLRKEFWQAQRQKQEYEKEAGDLWPTDKVVEKVSGLVKLVAISVRLFSDAVERNSELTDRQKQVIQQLTDGMLDDLRKKMVKEFEGDEEAEEDTSL